MGVLVQTKEWAANKAVVAKGKVGNAVTSEAERIQTIIKRVLAMAPEFPCNLVRVSAENVLYIVENILQFGPVSWTKRNLYMLYKSLAEALDTLLSAIAPWITEPTKWVMDQLVNAATLVSLFMYNSFEMVDDRLVTPVYEVIGNATTTTRNACKRHYNMVKDNAVGPVLSCVNSTVVLPVYSRVSDATSCVKSTAIRSAAMVDNKLSLLSWMYLIVEQARRVDDCTTSGAIEKKVVLPILNSATTVDKTFTGGYVTDFVETTKSEFNQAKGGNKDVAGRVVQGRVTNTTSAGAPVMSRAPRY